MEDGSKLRGESPRREIEMPQIGRRFPGRSGKLSTGQARTNFGPRLQEWIWRQAETGGRTEGEWRGRSGIGEIREVEVGRWERGWLGIAEKGGKGGAGFGAG